MAGGGERRMGRGRAERTPGGKRGGPRSRGKARSSAPRRPRRAATAVVEAGGGAPGVRPTETDASAAETPARAEGARTERAPRGVQRSAAPSGVRLSLDALTVDALQAEVER